jgi:REP element-mobilizing transposase RayT
VPDQALAYLITFRCYGTWLPGDERGSHRWHDKRGAPALPVDPGIARNAQRRMSQSATSLDPAQRVCVENAVRDVCEHRLWRLLAANARSNHVHAVVSGAETPERIMNTLKSWSTRALRSALLVPAETVLWSRHGSTVYLWDEGQVDNACAYVLHGQDK